jgi:hypothetical protein
VNRIPHQLPLLIATLGSALVWACVGVPLLPGGSTQRLPAEVRVHAADFSVQAPDALAAGWTRFVLDNPDQAPANASLFRLNQATTNEGFQQAAAQGFAAMQALATPLGGPVSGPNTSVEVVLDVSAGQYALVGPRAAVRPFVVGASTARVAQPTSDVEVKLRDFSFEMPATLSSGRRTLGLANTGAQMHELLLGRLGDGKSTADLVSWSTQPQGPPPLEPLGGLVGLQPGATGYLTLDLSPGSFVAVCFIPDPSTRQSHLALGMVQDISVR